MSKTCNIPLWLFNAKFDKSLHPSSHVINGKLHQENRLIGFVIKKVGFDLRTKCFFNKGFVDKINSNINFQEL